MPRQKNKKRFDPLPWYALLDMEYHVEQTPLPPRPKGRPRARFTRKTYNLRMTEDQIKIFDGILVTLSNQFNRSVQRGDLVAFLTVRLLMALQTETDEAGNFILPEWVKSFNDLAKYLDEIE